MTPTLRRAASAVAYLLLAGACVFVAARLQGGRPPVPWPQLAAFTPFGLLPALAALAIAALARRRVPLLLAGALVLFFLCLATPLGAPSGGFPRERAGAGGHGEKAGGSGPGEGALTVMTVNVHEGQGDCGQVVGAVRRHRVDVLSVQELTQATVDRLSEQGIGRELPYRHIRPGRVAEGTGLWSRFPVAPLDDVPGTLHVNPRATVRISPGFTVTVTAVHPISPRPGTVELWHRDLQIIGGAVAKTRGPQIVAGDFNATRDHASFRAILRHGLRDAADGGGIIHRPGWTWPTDHGPLPLVRVDHILVTPRDFKPTDTRLHAIRGTDHRAVLVRLSVSPIS